jgi:hypothetical protein
MPAAQPAARSPGACKKSTAWRGFSREIAAAPLLCLKKLPARDFVYYTSHIFDCQYKK